jgi:hypothetical protein
MRGLVEFKVPPDGLVAKNGVVAVVRRNESTPLAGESAAALRRLNQSKSAAATAEHQETYSALSARRQALLRQRSYAVQSVQLAVSEADSRKETRALTSSCVAANFKLRNEQ